MHSNTRAGMIDAPVPPEGEEEDGEEDDDTGGGFGGIGDIMFCCCCCCCFAAGCFLVRLASVKRVGQFVENPKLSPQNGAGCGKKPHKTKV